MYVHRTNNGKRISQYTCPLYSKVPVGVLCRTQHRINESAVLSLVSNMLLAISDFAKNDRSAFIRTVQETLSKQQTTDISKKRKRLVIAQKRAGELEKLICKIYEDNVLGKLPDAHYAALDAQYAKEQDALTEEINELEKDINGYDESQKGATKFISLVDKYGSFETLTNTMFNEFVEKIMVHERDRKGSTDTTQEVEIYFNFVGRYVPPHYGEAELTQEEQEALRKKEELKDRRHEAYLRRKASEAQSGTRIRLKRRKSRYGRQESRNPCRGSSKRYMRSCWYKSGAAMGISILVNNANKRGTILFWLPVPTFSTSFAIKSANPTIHRQYVGFAANSR